MMSDPRKNENQPPQFGAVQQPLIVATRGARPDDYMTYSILNAFCCFCGFIPLIYSLKSRDSYYLGDYTDALDRSKQAKRWNIIVLIVSIILITITIISYVSKAVILASQANQRVGFSYQPDN